MVNYIDTHGVFLAYRNYKGQKFALYQLSSFYLELRYSTKPPLLEDIIIFENTDELDPYLRKIVISWLPSIGQLLQLQKLPGIQGAMNGTDDKMKRKVDATV